jgi:hypothetical protein
MRNGNETKKGQIERGNRMGCIWKAQGTGKGKCMVKGKAMRKKGRWNN